MVLASGQKFLHDFVGSFHWITSAEPQSWSAKSRIICWTCGLFASDFCRAFPIWCLDFQFWHWCIHRNSGNHLLDFSTGLMRQLHTVLRAHCNWDLRCDYAVATSSFVASVWWCYRVSAITCSFLDTHSRQRLWICNSILYVESKDLSFSITHIVFQLPSHPDEDWEVPTPPVAFTDPWVVLATGETAARR